jgi:hypothetical protein
MISTHEAIAGVLRAYGIDPEQVVNTDTGPRTAFQVLEAHVMAGIDEIEEGTPE